MNTVLTFGSLAYYFSFLQENYIFWAAMILAIGALICWIMAFIKAIALEKLLKKEQEDRKALEIKEKEQRKALQAEKDNLAIISSIGKTFFTMYYLDLVNDIYQEVVSKDNVHELLGRNGKASEGLQLMVDKMVVDEDKTAISEFNRFDTIAERLRGKTSISQEYIGKVAGWCRAVIIPVHYDKDGNVINVLYVARQIGDEKARETSRQQLQKEIRQVHESYKMLHKLIKSGMWSSDYDRKGVMTSVHWSDEFRHMIGYKDETDFPNTMEAWAAILHPDDWAAGYESHYAVLDDKTGSKIYDVEYRLKTKDKGWRWFRATGTVIRRSDGSPIKFYGVFFDINDQKEHEAYEAERIMALERAKKSMAAMVAIHESMGSGNWSVEFDKTAKEKSCHFGDALRKMLGYKDTADFPNEMEAFTRLIHNDDKAYVLNDYWETVRDYSGRRTYSVEYRMLTRHAGWRWFHAAGRLLRHPDGRPQTFYGVFIDIDDQKRNAEELNNAMKKQKEDFCVIKGLSNEFHTVWLITASDRHIRLYRQSHVNNAANYIKDAVDYESFIRSYIDKYVAGEDRDRLRRDTSLETVQQRISQDSVYKVNYRRLDGKGGVTYHQMGFAKAESSDGVVNIVLGYRDIDAEVREEQKRQKALQDALESAQHANKAKTTFLNNMSHDIRTPMNAIIGFTSLAAAHIDNIDLVKDYLGKITTSSTHLLSLINDVLDMSRIESGKVKIEAKDTSLPEIMHDLKTIVQADVHAKRLDFYIDTLDIVNENIICDRLRLNQVLLNLLSNAMKFTEPGGMISVRVIQKSCGREGWATYDFKVKDSGIGMSAEFLEHVFDPFERERSSTVSGIQGTGLGMAITKNIVDMMGGTIGVVSERGKGTEFTVTLDFEISDNEAKQEIIPELQGLRALVVDDDYTTCSSVTKMLQSIGMRSDWTTSGKEAVMRAQHAIEMNDEFKAYIIDWIIPDMNGIEIVRRIRRVIGESKPIIILTAYDWSEIEEEAREAGVTGFCSKPLFLSELKNVLIEPFRSPTQDEKKDGGEEFSFEGKRILLVEDNELNQEIAEEILKDAGFEVDIADDGSVAVDKLEKAEPGRYDLVLMDIQMPIMNGYEATAKIRGSANEAVASIPIVAMTANAFEEDKQHALQAGMNGHIAKPIEIAGLLNMLRSLLK
ncbi:response regulator [bacterium]|nr:response regulator [bacterium]